MWALLPTAAALAYVLGATSAPGAARVGSPLPALVMQADGRTVVGGNTHANLHHIDVPSPTAAAVVPDDANNILGKKEQRGAKQETRMQEPIAGEFTHANLHHIDVPKAGR